MKEHYRTFEIARAWECSTHTVRRLIDAGTIKGFRFNGKERRAYRDSLAAYCAEMGLRMPDDPKPPVPKPKKPGPMTSGEVARACGVSPRTVANWMDSGLLKGYRIPGSQDRRFLREEVYQFLVATGVPVPRELMCGARVTYGITLPAPVPGWDVCDAFQLGELCSEKPILAAVLGDEAGVDEAVKMAGHIRRNNPEAVVVFVLDPSNAAAAVPGEVRVRGEVELGEVELGELRGAM